MIKGTWLKAVRRITSSSFESTRCVFLAAPRSATQCQQVNARGLAPDFQTCQVKIKKYIYITNCPIPSKPPCVFWIAPLAFAPTSHLITVVAQSSPCCVFIRKQPANG